MAVELTDSNFGVEVDEFHGVVLVDYWAAWCGPCRMMAPIVEQLAQKYAGNEKVKIAKLDSDTNPYIAQQEQVMALPTFKVYAAGQPVGMKVGVSSPQDLENLIERALNELAKAA